MKEKIFSYLTGLLACLLLPYFFTMAINGVDTALLARSADLEICIPALVSLQIPKNYELEAVKSQAVIARTNLYRRYKEGKDLREVLTELKDGMDKMYTYWYIPDKIYEKAAQETKGEILSLDGDLKLVPYHELSAGKTRDGEEVFHDQEYAYLKSVDSSVDKESPDYLNSTYIPQQQMPQNISVTERDSAGYAASLKADDAILEGEAFRQGMGLSSANFTIQRIGEEIRFLCKGKGHGLGFSQYGGNAKAKSGETYEAILKTYFPELSLNTVDRIFRNV